MTDSFKNKLAALNTIALWLLLLVVGGWLLFKSPSNITKSTVDKLTVAVDKISVTADSVMATANAQREWTNSLRESTAASAQKRENDYEDLYSKYGYDPKIGPGGLSDFYTGGLQQSEDIGRGQLHNSTGPTPKAPTVQNPISKP